MKLFDVNKVGVFCDAIKHHNEPRKSGDTKVITLTCRVDPFDSKLAVALSEDVRRTLFKLNHPDPQPHIRRADFTLGVERQQLLVFASSDTPMESIAFDHVKISRLYVRTKKDANGFVLVFDATFGPVGDRELAYVEAWRGTQRSITFEAAEPNLDFEEDGEQDDEDDEPSTKRQTPMFDTTAAGQPLEAGASEPEPARHLPRRNPTKKPH